MEAGEGSIEPRRGAGVYDQHREGQRSLHLLRLAEPRHAAGPLYTFLKKLPTGVVFVYKAGKASKKPARHAGAAIVAGTAREAGRGR
jgi:hypothetical protein